jgi:arylsulfatase A-like enzyme
MKFLFNFQIFGKLLILLIGLLMMTCPAGLQAAKPNVLFIAIDDLKPMLGCYGDKQVQSPRIDQLAKRGLVFENSQCQFPVCGPSRASLLTGLRPDTTKVYDLKTKMRDIHPDILTLPQHFKNNGYETVGMGKIFDSRCVDNREAMDQPSWSIPYVHVWGKGDLASGFANPETVEWFRSQKDAKGKKVSEWSVKNVPPVEGSEDVPDNTYNDGAIADEAVEWIGKLSQQDKPFFLAVGFQKPHLPFIAPKKYWDLYQRSDFSVAEYQQAPQGTPEFTLQPGWEIRGKYDVPKQGPFPDELQLELIHGYYACVSYVDAQVGKVIDALEAAGIADNTIIVLWGDHGWHLGDHSMWCKHSVYEQAARAPLIISAPGQKVAGASTREPVEFTDIFPTLCELTGLEAPGSLEGISLKPLLDQPDADIRQVAMTQYYRSPGGKSLMGYSFRDERYRYTEWRERKNNQSKGDGPVFARELYDYEADPLETKNLIDDPASVAVRDRLQAAAATVLARYGIGE